MRKADPPSSDRAGLWRGEDGEGGRNAKGIGQRAEDIGHRDKDRGQKTDIREQIAEKKTGLLDIS
jgi:hypothetical protein